MCSSNLSVFRNETSKEKEDWYESEVVERHIHNKFQIRYITGDTVSHLKRINYLYVHFKRIIIDGNVTSDGDIYDFDDASDYSESEHLIVEYRD